MLPKVERLCELFEYNPETGLVVRTRSVRGKGSTKGTIVGTPNSHGHLICRVDYQICYVHRIAWKMYYGEEPPPILDHKDRNKTNNKISNLRKSTVQQNGQNRNLNKNSKTGIAGVRLTPEGRWKANIRANKKNIHLGYFDTKELAADARVKAELLHWGGV